MNSYISSDSIHILLFCMYIFFYRKRSFKTWYWDLHCEVTHQLQASTLFFAREGETAYVIWDCCGRLAPEMELWEERFILFPESFQISQILSCFTNIFAFYHILTSVIPNVFITLQFPFLVFPIFLLPAGNIASAKCVPAWVKNAN